MNTHYNKKKKIGFSTFYCAIQRNKTNKHNTRYINAITDHECTMWSNKANIQFIDFLYHKVNRTCISHIIAPQRNWNPIDWLLVFVDRFFSSSLFYYYYYFFAFIRSIRLDSQSWSLCMALNAYFKSISRSENKTNRFFIRYRTYTTQSFSTSKGLKCEWLIFRTEQYTYCVFNARVHYALRTFITISSLKSTKRRIKELHTHFLNLEKREENTIFFRSQIDSLNCTCIKFIDICRFPGLLFKNNRYW